MQAFWHVPIARRSTKQESRKGALFQGRFQRKHVADESYLLHLTRYIHLNPVDAGLVRHAEDWIYSSYREYIGLRAGSLPQKNLVLQDFDSEQHYRNFVESRLPMVHASIRDLTFEEEKPGFTDN